MTPLETALGIISLLETVEPGVQAAVLAIVKLWQNNSGVKTILQGEVTGLGAIAAKARVEEGLPPATPPTDPDPIPAT